MNELLYGHNPLEQVVAAHQLNDTTIRVYRRTNGKITHEDAEFFPFFFLSSDRFLEGYPNKVWLKHLAGNNYYQYLAAFPRWSEMWEAVRHVMREYNAASPQRVESYTNAEVLVLKSDPVSQYLMQSGTTYFKGMAYDDVYRLQLDIETYSKDYKFSDARKTEDRIIVIALSDNRGWKEIIDGTKLDEPEMLRNLCSILREKDPDIIEGHNLYGFDLPYLLKRCELHGIDFAIGRDNSVPRAVTLRSASAENEAEVLSYELNGRNLVDTLLLAQAYDIFSQSLDSYGLKYLAQHFGFASPDRVYIPGNKISWYWDHEPGQLLRYALDDIDETRLLSEHLSPSYFYLSQICPLPYSTVTRSGSTMKIESLLLREYMRQRYSVPKPSSGLQTTGGYSDIFLTGVLSDVIHADVESLYPSIIVSNGIMPRHDGLRIFPALLLELLAMRMKAKQTMRQTTEPLLRSKYDALQSSYKILINSFYGYLGYSKGLFSDFEQADVVTTTGQKLLRDIMNQVELYNGKVIEVDTDGLYFLPPDNVRGEAQETAFVQRLSESLPQGISLAFTGHYSKMLSYKKKNYALQDAQGKIIIKGSSLTSRSLERFIRSYLRQCVACLLREDIQGLHDLYVSTVDALKTHQVNVYDFCKTERLHDSIERYNNEIAAGSRNPAAAYEVAKRSGLTARERQSIAYYVTGSHHNIRIIDNCRLAEEWDSNFPDENTAYYVSRLDDASSKFELFFTPRHFAMLFSVDSLFGFSAEGIHIVTKPVQDKEAIKPDPEVEETEGFGIWIDNQKT